MGKYKDSLGSSALVRQLVWEKENSEFKPVKLRLKKIDLVSYPARAEGLVNMIRIRNSFFFFNVISTFMGYLIPKPSWYDGVSFRGVMAKVLDFNMIVSDFQLQLHNYVHFWTNTFGKEIETPLSSIHGLNSSTELFY